MDYKDWKILKTELEQKQEEYSQVAQWCNENGYHIEEDGKYYKVKKNPEPVAPTLEQRVLALESKYEMNRWQREAIMNNPTLYSEYTFLHAKEIEDLAKDLRG